MLVISAHDYLPPYFALFSSYRAGLDDANDDIQRATLAALASLVGFHPNVLAATRNSIFVRGLNPRGSPEKAIHPLESKTSRVMAFLGRPSKNPSGTSSKLTSSNMAASPMSTAAYDTIVTNTDARKSSNIDSRTTDVQDAWDDDGWGADNAVDPPSDSVTGNDRSAAVNITVATGGKNPNVSTRQSQRREAAAARQLKPKMVTPVESVGDFSQSGSEVEDFDVMPVAVQKTVLFPTSSSVRNNGADESAVSTVTLSSESARKGMTLSVKPVSKSGDVPVQTNAVAVPALAHSASAASFSTATTPTALAPTKARGVPAPRVVNQEADLFSDMEPTYRAPPKTSTGMSTTNAITGNKVAGRNDDEEDSRSASTEPFASVSNKPSLLSA